MSGEKTEQPTSKRLKDARKKGQVAKSNDLTQAFLFLVAGGVLTGGGSLFVDELRALMIATFQPNVLAGELSEKQILARIGHGFGKFLLLSAPMLGALVLASVAAGYMQVKGLFTFEVIKPKFDKLNPVKGFQNIFFKARTYLELIKNLIKFTVILYLVYGTISDALKDVVLTARVPLERAATLAGDLLATLMFKVGGVFLVIGAVDYMLQKKQFMKGLKMSKDEVHREYKEDEGDPHIKHQRKHIHQEMLAESEVHNVPKADVVVVNPTHIAVALKYDEKTMNAPRIVAKGQEKVAHKIIEIAKAHKRPVLRNVPLARNLFQFEVGSEIPEELYEAVAEVLNWVYELANAEKR